MTNQQIAEKSNLPESTVARIFSGKTPNPTIATAVSMARAMGGSAADFMNEEDEAATVRPSSSAPEWGAGTVQSDAARTPSASENTNTSLPETDGNVSAASYPRPPEGGASHDTYYEDIILFYKNAIKKKDEWIARLFWCALRALCCSFCLF